MSRRAARWILGLAFVFLAGGLLWWWLSERGSGLSWSERRTAAAEPGVTLSMDLYFPSEAGGLEAERRGLKVTEAPKDRIRKVVQALLAGPQAKGLVRPFPEGVTLESVQLGDDGTAYIDLAWEGHQEPPASGSTEEMQRVYSVVNSVAFNVPQARRVTLLWNGVQRVTFAGHLDTSRPLPPNRELLSR